MPDVELIACRTFGGGWIVPRSDTGRDVLEGFFNDLPAELMPLGGQEGYIVEPYEVEPLCDYLQAMAVEIAV